MSIRNFFLRLIEREFLSDESQFWRSVHLWEEEQADELETDENWQATNDANELFADDPPAAIARCYELSDRGSPWAALTLGWCHERGVTVQQDDGLAIEWYYKAICNGSWYATLGYARLLEHHGYHIEVDDVLQDGVDKGFAPALYRLAILKYRRKPGRKSANEVRELLEQARLAGHPASELFLAGLAAFGRFGVREIPQGWRRLRKVVRLIRLEGEETRSQATGTRIRTPG
jgi:hypothetical protein